MVLFGDSPTDFTVRTLPFSVPRGRQEHDKAAANTSALIRRLRQTPRAPHPAPRAGRCAAAMTWNGCGKGKGSKVCGKR